MSLSKVVLHGDALLRLLTETSLAVQRVRTVEQVFEVAGRGLEALGFEVAVIELEGSTSTVPWLSDRTHLHALRQLIFPDTPAPSFSGPLGIKSASFDDSPLFIEDLREALEAFLGTEGLTVSPEHLEKVQRVGVLAPLNVGRAQWGVLLLMQDDLREEDLGVIRLFALQLGSAIEVCEAFEQLERRNAEMSLVHALAVAGPVTDSRALCRKALQMVCGSTNSDCGLLHRYDTQTRSYEMVGDAFGYEGPLVAAFRSFRIDPQHPLAQRSLSLPTRLLPNEAEFVRREGMIHMALIPLRIEGKDVGLLSLARTTDVPYVESDVASAELLGVQMASMIERARLSDEAARLYEDVKRSYDELGRTQQELVRHERLAALGELAAVMAHEVRNPLGVIFNSLTTLKRLLRPSGDAEMLLNMVGEEADRLNRIVGDLLEFVRPYELMKKPVAVEPIIASAVDSVAQSTLNANVRVLTQFPRELAPFPIDAHMMKQALVNLIVNAAQAMPKGGTVTVEVFVEPMPAGGPWLVVRVSDEGVGLSERVTAKMFQPFFTTKATGTGLGLAVVKRIVDAHLGEVSAKAADHGVGTVFTMRFPPTTETRSGNNTPPRPSPAVRR